MSGNFIGEFLKAIIDGRDFEFKGTPEIFETLVSHSLEGIFYHFGKNKVSKELSGLLSNRLSFLIARDTLQRRFLKEISMKMKKRKLRFLVIKGPAIADLLYPSLMRFYEDIDILVHEEDYLSAKECVLKSGFLPYVGRDGFFFTPAFKEEILIHRNKDYLQIDLHRALFSKYRFNMDFDNIWSSSVEFIIDGVEVRKMDPFTEFIYLLLHSAAHFYRLKGINILDIALHFRKFNHDIKEVLKEMKNDKNHYGGYYILKFLIKNGYISFDENELEDIKPSLFSEILMKFFTSTERVNYLRFEKLPFLVRAGTVLASIPGFFNKTMFVYHYLRRRTDAFFKNRF